MSSRAIFVVVLLCVVCVSARAADIALVRGGSIYDRITEGFLAKSGVEYDPLTEAEVTLERLAAYRLVIFPFNNGVKGDAIQAVADYVAAGGRIMWMSGLPPALSEILGIGKWTSRGVEYPGEFSVMVFTEDRPPGFPAQVHQTSPNSRLVSEVLDNGRPIAYWHDLNDKDLGFPAVIVTDATVWTAHVFWAGANADEQRQLLLASICYLLPDKTAALVARTLAEAIPATGYESPEALAQAAEGNAIAEPLAARVVALAEEARRVCEGATPADGLALAQELNVTAQLAAAAMFPSRPYEMRGAWMHPGDDFDYEAAMQELADAGFNAVFPIVCGPNYTKYQSDFAPMYTDRDHVRECIDAARKHGIEVHLWKANWQASPRRNAELCQQFIDEGRMVASIDMARGGEEKGPYPWRNLWLDPSDDRNRDLEFDMMMELVDKYHPDGIHFDFMRYPSASYCYCDRCRAKFQEWAGLTVEDWPDDCYGAGKLVDRYLDWRRHLQTSLVARIAEGARQRDPDVQISLAARASMTGSYDGDAQDWVTWANEGYLDMLCPMDYTNSVDVLRDKLAPQVLAIEGAVPVYAGIGVSPTRSDSAVNLSEQIVAARELGADGFLLFSLSQFARGLLPAVKLGVTSVPVTVMPHHVQSATAEFAYPETPEGIPARTYGPGGKLNVPVTVRATGDDVAQIIVQAYVEPAAGGGEAMALTGKLSVRELEHAFEVEVAALTGCHCIVLRGEVVFKDARKEEFYLRSLPLRVLSPEAFDDLTARSGPPVFRTDDIRVGVVVDCYGSEGIIEALRASDGFEVRPVAGLTADYLAPCDVLILPQPQEDPRRVNPETVTNMREFVTAGGGMLATRDVIGAWIYKPLFAEICTGDGTVIKSLRVTVAAEHAITAGLQVGADFTHAHTDHLPLALSDDATALMSDPDGRPVMACGEVGEGRFVACGFAIGRGASSPDTMPNEAERTLLAKAVRWLAAD